MGVIGRQKQLLVNKMDKSNILNTANNHADATHILDFSGFTKNAPRGTTNQKVASSSLAGRTIKINNLQLLHSTLICEIPSRYQFWVPIFAFFRFAILHPVLFLLLSLFADLG